MSTNSSRATFDYVRAMNDMVRDEANIKKMFKDLEARLPPIDPAKAPTFNLSGALDDLIDFVSLIACRQGASESEFVPLVGPVIDLWDNISYILHGKEKSIAARRKVRATRFMPHRPPSLNVQQRLLQAISNNFFTFLSIPRRDREDVIMVENFTTLLNMPSSGHPLQSQPWANALSIEWHVQEKVS